MIKVIILTLLAILSAGVAGLAIGCIVLLAAYFVWWFVPFITMLLMTSLIFIMLIPVLLYGAISSNDFESF